MTRRLNPQDRVNELGDASVPFKFDVHSFIFSEDAVGLESKLHSMLNEKRVNKVNARKEFFYTSVDELESLVNEIEPTAEFNKTMLAEEFRQSQSSSENYTSSFIVDSFEDDEINKKTAPVLPTQRRLLHPKMTFIYARILYHLRGSRSIRNFVRLLFLYLKIHNLKPR